MKKQKKQETEKQEVFRRPCCGATAPVERLWPGSFHFPHLRGCPRFR